MRRPFIAGNWKMNLDGAAIQTLIKAIRESASTVATVDVGVFPPYPYIPMVVEALKGSNVCVGGQDLYFETKGAFTGQVSGDMLKDVGAGYVLIGHSERRHVFGETNADTRLKVKAALDAGLKPMLCLGEQLPERESGKTAEVVLSQVAEGLKGFSEQELQTLEIAYEPVWAIGTGVTASPEQASEAHQIIRGWFNENYSADFAEKVRILYGGSVNPENVDNLMSMEGVDGALVGGASLKAESFCRLIQFNH